MIDGSKVEPQHAALYGGYNLAPTPGSLAKLEVKMPAKFSAGVQR